MMHGVRAPLHAPRVAAARARSRAEDVMHLERLVDLREPFGPVGGTTPASFVEREFQLAQKAGDLLACGDVTEARPHSKRGLVKMIERRQATREKFAVHHAFGKAVDGTKGKLQRELVEAF